MSTLYLLATLVALGLAVYLVWALFRPEDFS
jgi:K+-transporting ATPase KdpF subunit